VFGVRSIAFLQQTDMSALKKPPSMNREWNMWGCNPHPHIFWFYSRSEPLFSGV
jgi:hypothetical protein